VCLKKFLESTLSGSAFRLLFPAEHVYLVMAGDAEEQDVQSVLWRIVTVPVMAMNLHLLVAPATDGTELGAE